MRKNVFLLGLLSTVFAGSAMAQTVSEVAEEKVADTKRLGTVVVTSRKVEESLAEVPLAITAFSAADIEKAGLTDLSDVADFTPGLTFLDLFGASVPTPVIRGVAQTAVGQENNTAVFVDGVFIGASTALNLSQIDFERIEVVKGPQSALYGRNSFSGAINFVTAKPDNEFGAKLELKAGNRGRQKVMASMTGPIVEDKIAGRIALAFDGWDGSYDNEEPGGGDIGGYEYKTVNGSLRFTPTEDWDINLTGYYSDDDIDPPAIKKILANCEYKNGGPRAQNFCGSLPDADEVGSFRVLPQAEGGQRETFRTYVSANYDQDWGSISALASYSEVEFSFTEDGSRALGSTFPYVYTNLTGGIDTFESSLLQVDLPDTSTEMSGELRYTTPQDQKWRGSAGAFYYSSEDISGGGGTIVLSDLPDDFKAFCPCASLAPGFTLGFGNGAFLGAFGPTGTIDTTDSGKRTTDSWAVFASTEFDFTSALTGRAEVRYAQDEIKFLELRTGNNGGDTFESITARFGLDYVLEDGTLLYASAARGAKSGGFDTGSDNGRFVVSAFDPESNWTYEFGMKTNSIADWFYTELAVFYVDWKDIVVPQLDESFAPPISFDVNGGEAKVFGVEGSFVAEVTDNLSINGGVAWTDAEFTDAKIDTFSAFPGFGPDGDVSGLKVQRQPEWQGNLTVSYDKTLTSDFDGYVRGDMLYRGKFFSDATNQTVHDARTTFNLRTGVRGDRYSLELWGENILDDGKSVASFRDVFFNNTTDGVTSPSDFSTFFPLTISATYPNRRTYGLTLRVNY